ncbi:MAG: glycosyltransferase [Puniceicoccales bacterium]|jgi:glycosyltransferase involved in cell wall biosynthesis|nr:glycosyltransferase [Puniceicoccales bacterium]
MARTVPMAAPPANVFLPDRRCLVGIFHQNAPPVRKPFFISVLGMLSMFSFGRAEEFPTNAPQVAICMPVYNSELYLPMALDSALSQTLQEAEIICVDDGSTDGSLAILKSYAQKYPQKVTVLENGTNRGTCYSRMRAILAARGEFILWLDSDDILFPKTAELAYNAAIKNGADVVQFRHQSIKFIRGEQLPKMEPLKVEEKPHVRSYLGSPLHMLSCQKISPVVWDKLWRTKNLKEMAKRVLHFVEKCRIIKNEDNFFVWNALTKCEKCIFMNHVGIRHHTDSGLAAQNRNNMDFYRQWAEGLVKYSKFILENEEDPEIQKMYANWHPKVSQLGLVLRTIPLEESVRMFNEYLAAYPEELRATVRQLVKKHSGKAQPRSPAISNHCRTGAI